MPEYINCPTTKAEIIKSAAVKEIITKSAAVEEQKEPTILRLRKMEGFSNPTPELKKSVRIRSAAAEEEPEELAFITLRKMMGFDLDDY